MLSSLDDRESRILKSKPNEKFWIVQAGGREDEEERCPTTKKIIFMEAVISPWLADAVQVVSHQEKTAVSQHFGEGVL